MRFILFYIWMILVNFWQDTMILYVVSPSLVKTTGGKGTGDVTAERIVVDMSDPEMLDPDTAALLLLMGKITGKRVVHDTTFKWQEDDYVPLFTTLNGTFDYSGDPNGALTVLDTTPFRVDDLVVIPQISDEVWKVTVITNATTMTIASLDGGNMEDFATTGHYVQIIGNWNEEGSGKRKIISTQPSIPYNHTQILKTDTGETNTLGQVKVYGPEELARDQKKAKVEHDLKIQRAMLLGNKYEDTTGTNPKRAMGGIIEFCTENVTNLLGNPLTESEWEAFLESGFLYGSDVKYVLCSSRVISYLSAWARNKIQTVSKDKTYGINVTEYLSPHGKVYLLNARKIFNASPWTTMALMLDLVNLRYVVLGNRDTKLKTNIQAPDEDQRIDEYLTECSIEIKMEETHALLKNVG